MIIINRHHYAPWASRCHRNAPPFASFLYSHGPRFHARHHQHYSNHHHPSSVDEFTTRLFRNLLWIAVTWFFLSVSFRVASLVVSLFLSPLFMMALLVTMLSVAWHGNLHQPFQYPPCRRNNWARRHRHRHPFSGDNTSFRQHWHADACHPLFQNLTTSATFCSTGRQAAPGEQQQASTEENHDAHTPSPPPSSTSDFMGVHDKNHKEEESKQDKNKTILKQPSNVRCDEKADWIVITMDIPRFEQKDLELSLDARNALSISGQHKVNEGDTLVFQTKIPLDTYQVDTSDLSAVKANLSLGVLEITIPKVTKEEEKRKDHIRVIPITVSPSQPSNTKRNDGEEVEVDVAVDTNNAGIVETVQEVEEQPIEDTYVVTD